MALARARAQRGAGEGLETHQAPLPLAASADRSRPLLSRFSFAPGVDENTTRNQVGALCPPRFAVAHPYTHTHTRTRVPSSRFRRSPRPDRSPALPPTAARIRTKAENKTGRTRKTTPFHSPFPPYTTEQCSTVAGTVQTATAPLCFAFIPLPLDGPETQNKDRTEQTLRHARAPAGRGRRPPLFFARSRPFVLLPPFLDDPFPADPPRGSLDASLPSPQRLSSRRAPPQAAPPRKRRRALARRQFFSRRAAFFPFSHPASFMSRKSIIAAQFALTQYHHAAVRYSLKQGTRRAQHTHPPLACLFSRRRRLSLFFLVEPSVGFSSS